MKKIKEIWQVAFLRQSPLTRWVHAFIALLVVLQIIDSNFIDLQQAEHLLGLGTCVHIVVGSMLALLSILLISHLFTTRGLKHYFPYLFGEFRVLKRDLAQLCQLKLPDSQPYSLAACVQGLGLGALVLVLLSGYAWLFAWLLHCPVAHTLRHLHAQLTTLIEIYVCAHGAMALLHVLYAIYRRPA